MADSPEQFSANLRAVVERAGARAEQVVRKIMLDIGADLVMLSPVGNPELWKHPAPKGYVGGRFRANWQYGFGFTPPGVREERDQDGQDTIARLSAGIAEVTGMAGMHYIVNNLPYAQALEYGHSTQAPAGFVGITIVKFRGIAEAAARSATP